jgi:hypothetical protein
MNKKLSPQTTKKLHPTNKQPIIFNPVTMQQQHIVLEKKISAKFCVANFDFGSKENTPRTSPLTDP